ncbi:MAG: hypothetical protein ACYC59_07455 [Anaerolineaceae bacterium]
MTQEYTISIDSSDSISNTVNRLPNSRLFIGVSKKAINHPLFDPPREISINLAKLFFSLGKITTPQNVFLNRINSLWPFFKYSWVFERGSTTSNLIFSEIADDMDFHQKSLMSDELGVGMAVLITEQFFGGLNPIDVDFAIRYMSYGRIDRQYNTSPDYLFKTTDGDLIIVECKGTQSGKNYAFKQLKRGTEQVSSLVLPSGENALSLVISTCFERNATDVRIIDPPIKDEGDNPKKYQIEDIDKFNETVDRLQILNLYLYIGDFVHAEYLLYHFFREIPRFYKYYPKYYIKDYPKPYIKHISEIESSYYGQSITVNSNNEKTKFTIFQGLYENIYKELLSSMDMSSINDIAETQYKKVKENIEDNNETSGKFNIICKSTDSDSNYVTSLYSRDGRMMQIAIEYL